jgi:hypothetical protein
MTGYDVSVNDCAGEYLSRTVAEFSAALALYVAFRAKYPGKVVLVSNLDRCDYNTDGLTEDEQDAIDSVLVVCEHCPDFPHPINDDGRQCRFPRPAPHVSP